MALADWRRLLSYGGPGVVVGLTLAWWAGGRDATAQASNPGVDANGTIAFTSPAGSGQLLYLIDTRDKSFAIYRVDTQSSRAGSVKLEAARQYRYDLKLSEYNNLPPEVTSVEAMIRNVPAKR
jgi:hypothetical protein